jgi:hypothetical protein
VSEPFDQAITLDASQIRSCLEELGEQMTALGVDRQVTVAIAGGSCLALMGLRDTTVDVDVVSRLSEELSAAVRAVAESRGLSPTWLNTRALAWRPRGLRNRDCEVLIDGPALRVVGVPPDALLLMKLNRSSDPDIADMRRLWPLCSYQSAADVVTRFYEAYPDENFDEFLVDHVREVLHLSE